MKLTTETFTASEEMHKMHELSHLQQFHAKFLIKQLSLDAMFYTGLYEEDATIIMATCETKVYETMCRQRIQPKQSLWSMRPYPPCKGYV